MSRSGAMAIDRRRLLEGVLGVLGVLRCLSNWKRVNKDASMPCLAQSCRNSLSFLHLMALRLIAVIAYPIDGAGCHYDQVVCICMDVFPADSVVLNDETCLMRSRRARERVSQRLYSPHSFLSSPPGLLRCSRHACTPSHHEY